MPDLTAQQLAQAMTSNTRWADRLGWADYAAAISTLIASDDNDPASSGFAQALANWQAEKNLSIDGILGPDTWKAMQPQLAPQDSLTGVAPADGPPVPDGFDQVIATFGDPHPYLSADGSISDDKKADWERSTLAKGTLPWPVPMDGGEFKVTFYAHRKLVTTFVAVFAEIARLNLKDLITSFDGIYDFRPIRGTTTRISLHAFGAAIDLNAATNELGTDGHMPQAIIEVFEHFGFFWGGNFHSRRDPMHFQYATGY